jgi:chorismate-pyruvate lyase
VLKKRKNRLSCKTLLFKVFIPKDPNFMRVGSKTSCSIPELYPLVELCRHENVPLPNCRKIRSSEVPEPYKHLLVHRHDMTGVLQKFHDQDIHLENVSMRHLGNRVLRKVTLVRDDGLPVEFGAIEIRLEHLPEEAQLEIIACKMPLGGILRQHKINYINKALGFFEVETNSLVKDALKIDTDSLLYGRINGLYLPNLSIFAQVIEILPPMKQTD